MTGREALDFELYVSTYAERCETAEQMERLSQTLHECIENAIMDTCEDEGIEDYEPLF